MKMTTKIKCEQCGYEWDTKSEKFFVTCPNCMKKTKRGQENDKGD